MTPNSVRIAEPWTPVSVVAAIALGAAVIWLVVWLIRRVAA